MRHLLAARSKKSKKFIPGWGCPQATFCAFVCHLGVCLSTSWIKKLGFVGRAFCNRQPAEQEAWRYVAAGRHWVTLRFSTSRPSSLWIFFLLSCRGAEVLLSAAEESHRFPTEGLMRVCPFWYTLPGAESGWPNERTCERLLGTNWASGEAPVRSSFREIPKF